MAKLINRPSQCAARIFEIPQSYCTVDNSVFLPCPSMFDFPTNCPLQNGITIPTAINELVAIAKTNGLLFEVCKRTKKLQTITLIENINENNNTL
jgi:hypothetical protein